MATATHVQSKCGICHQPYKRPKILPCFHSYCEVCLELQVSKAKPDTKFQCPFCMTDIDIPEGGVCSFQTNFYIETTEEEGLEERKPEEVNYSCENCDGEPKPRATSYCKVCEQTICDECALLHKKLKITKDHELASLKTVNNNRPDKHKLTCFKHESNVADCYCLTCEEFVCPSCEYEEHDQHKTEPINVAANIKRNLLIKTWQTSEIFISTERNLNIISDRESDFEKMEKEAKDRLQRRAVEMKDDIDGGVKKLEAEITTICELEKLKLFQLKRDIEAAKEKSVAMKKLITLASDGEVLRDGNKMMFKIKEINISSPMDIPGVNRVKFENNCKELDYKSIGHIVNETKVLPCGDLEMKLVSAFCTPEFGEIKCILPCRRGNVWIAEAGTAGLIMFNEQGSKQKKILEDFEIESMAMGKDGTLFVSVPKEKSIYKITENYKARKLCSLSSSPGDLAAFDNGNIAVCCNEPPKLVIIDQTGQVVRQYAPRASMFKTLHCVAVCKFTDVLAVYAQDINPFSGTKQMDAGLKKAIKGCKAKSRQVFPVRMNTKASTQPTLNPFSILLPPNSKLSVDAPDVSKVKATQEFLLGLSAKAPIDPALSPHGFMSATNSESQMDTPEISKAKSTQFSFGTSTTTAAQIAQNPSGIFSATSSKSSADGPEVSQAKPTQEFLFGLSARAPTDPASSPHGFISTTNSKSSMDAPEIAKATPTQFFFGTSMKAATPIAPNPSGIISATISESSIDAPGIPKAKPTHALSFGAPTNAHTQPGLNPFGILSATSSKSSADGPEVSQAKPTQEVLFGLSAKAPTDPASSPHSFIAATNSKSSMGTPEIAKATPTQFFFGTSIKAATPIALNPSGIISATISESSIDAPGIPKARPTHALSFGAPTNALTQPGLNPFGFLSATSSKSSADGPEVSQAKPTQEALFGLSAKAPTDPASSPHGFISTTNSKSLMDTPEIAKATPTQFFFGTSIKATTPIAPNPSGIISATISESSIDAPGIPKAKPTHALSFGAPTNAHTQPGLNPFGILSATSSKSSADGPEVSQAKPTQEVLFGLSAKAPTDPASSPHSFIAATNSKSSMDTPEIAKATPTQFFFGTSIKAATPIAPNPSGIISATISESSIDAPGIPKAKPTHALSFGAPTNALTQPGLNPFVILSATSSKTAVYTREHLKTKTTQEWLFKTSLNTSTQPMSYSFGSISASSSKPSVDKADNKNTQTIQFGASETKGAIFFFDHNGNMLAKINRHVYDLIFDQRGHLLVSRVGGDIDVLDHRGNILACLRPNCGDFLSGKMALDSFNQMWIGESGRINVFKYPEISGAQKE